MTKFNEIKIGSIVELQRNALTRGKGHKVIRLKINVIFKDGDNGRVAKGLRYNDKEGVWSKTSVFAIFEDFTPEHRYSVIN